jgi:hypothetical protein
LVRLKWAEFVPLLREAKTDYLKEREKKLLEEEEQRKLRELSMSDLAANFSGTGVLKEGELVAGKVGTKNPLNRAEAIKRGPTGDFKWVERNGAWMKKFVDEDSSDH